MHQDMKKILYKSILALMATISLSVVSCRDAVPEENPYYSSPSEVPGVYFAKEDNSLDLVSLADTTVYVMLKRSDAQEAKTYNILSKATDETGTDVSTLIKVGQTACFEAGSTTAQVPVDISGLSYGINYTLEISVEGIRESAYAVTSTKYRIFCEDPEGWDLVCDTAVFVNNFWSSVLSGATIVYDNITVKRYQQTNRFRIYGLPEIFLTEWQVYFGLGNESELTKSSDYGIEIDCDKYSDEGARVKKLFMPFQSLGIKLGLLDGTSYNVGEVWGGSVAYNLQSASTGEPISEAMYPLGTYDTLTGVFRFGNIAVEYQDCDELGINTCRSEIALYLDPKMMETDLQDLQYKNVRRAVFHSKAYLNEDGSYMSQNTKVAQCVSEDYADAEKTFRINTPYTTSADLYFTHDKKTNRVKFPSGQIVGNTALGGYPILCEAKTVIYNQTMEKESYVFQMSFYYTNENGERYDLGTFQEELEMGSEITYFSADDLVPNHPIEDYVGSWVGEFTYIQDLNATIRSTVTIEADDEYTLIIRGLAPYMEQSNGYDSSLYMDSNDDTGVFDFFPQYANTFNGYQINAYTANLDDPNSELYMDNSMRVGFLADGRLAFVNEPDNANEVNCVVFYTPAQGGALVEPFIPYNLVLEKEETEDTEAQSNIPANILSMVPWSGFGNINKNHPRSNGHPAFTFSNAAAPARQFLKIKASGLQRPEHKN